MAVELYISQLRMQVSGSTKHMVLSITEILCSMISDFR